MKKIKEYSEKETYLLELEYQFIKQFIELRKNEHLSQQKMADNANVIRETITRIENLITSPQINTLIKILEPIGYTIKIVPIEKEGKK